MATFGDFLKKATEKATDVLQILRINDAIKFPGKEGDVIYSKNNVCVHPGLLNNEPIHVPGYLTLHCQKDETLGVTLVLQWLPNATLERNPGSIRTVSPRSATGLVPRSRVKLRNLEGSQKKKHSGRSSSGSSSSPPVLETSESQTTEDASDDEKYAQPRWQQNDVNPEINVDLKLAESTEAMPRAPASPCRPPELRLDALLAAPSITVIPNTPTPTATSSCGRGRSFNDQWESSSNVTYTPGVSRGSDSPVTSGADDDDELSDATASLLNAASIQSKVQADKQKSSSGQASEVPADAADAAADCLSSSYSSEGGGGGGSEAKASDEQADCGAKLNPSELPPLLMSYAQKFGQQWSVALDGPEEYARQHDMLLADGIVPSHGFSVDKVGPMKENGTSPEGACLFSIDLGKMRSFRLFYSNPECTSGQLVVSSLNSRYKILHFHNGGLDKLTQIFEQWGAVAAKSKKGNDSPLMSSLPSRQFAVLKSQVDKKESHPEEGLYQKITWDFWRSCMNSKGQIEDDLTLRKVVFFGGLEPALRKEAWPFLLSVYPWNSSFEQREQIRNDLFLEYQNIRKRRFKGVLKMGTKAWQYVENTIAKDVVRTDRKNTFFEGENNPNLEKMRSILLNYAAFCPQVGYIQGMSDMLAAVLSIAQDEADAFWCFAGLMQRSIFTMSEKGNDAMDANINYLRWLLKLLDRGVYDHLISVDEPSTNLLYAHRWILLCFKREFPQADSLQIWECCWSTYQTRFFHLFVCLAIICLYGEDVAQQKLPFDEILLYFASLAMHMNVGAVLTKARGLLYQFERLEKIPCVLANLCNFQNSGPWESGHVPPAVDCTGEHLDNESCPYYNPA